MVIREHVLQFPEFLLLLVADQQFSRSYSSQIIQERTAMSRLHYAELTCAEVGIGEAINAFVEKDRAEVVGAFRIQEIQIADRARTDDLRDFSRNNPARLGFACLIANRDPPARLNQLGDIA